MAQGNLAEGSQSRNCEQGYRKVPAHSATAAEVPAMERGSEAAQASRKVGMEAVRSRLGMTKFAFQAPPFTERCAGETELILGLTKLGESPEEMIAGYIGVLEESGYRGRIKIAFDEWNLRGWHHPGFPRKSIQNYNDPEVLKLVAAREKKAIASQYTMADALHG